MATRKSTTKKPAAKLKKVEQRVTAPKKTSRKIKVTETTFSGVNSPKQRVISRKYFFVLAIILALIGILFAASRLWIVAWVDNKPITKFELYALLEKRDEGKTAQELIEQSLLKSEGQKQRQAVTEGEIETEVKKVEEQQGGAAQLDQILAANRLSKEDFRKLVQLQLLKQKLFGQGVNVTDEDVDKYIEQNKDSLPPNILDNPESSEAARLKEGAKEQLKQMKINENYNKWVEEALKSSRVMKF